MRIVACPSTRGGKGGGALASKAGSGAGGGGGGGRDCGAHGERGEAAGRVQVGRGARAGRGGRVGSNGEGGSGWLGRRGLLDCVQAHFELFRVSDLCVRQPEQGRGGEGVGGGGQTRECGSQQTEG